MLGVGKTKICQRMEDLMYLGEIVFRLFRLFRLFRSFRSCMNYSYK